MAVVSFGTNQAHLAGMCLCRQLGVIVFVYLVVMLQATCSKAEASKRLADALAAADASQQALQEERSTAATLQQQLKALQEQLAQVREAQQVMQCFCAANLA